MTSGSLFIGFFSQGAEIRVKGSSAIAGSSSLSAEMSRMLFLLYIEAAKTPQRYPVDSIIRPP
jgi:hypothetical protein